ncbi:iron ABC transporter permease [Rothia sp. HMSC061E04]|uniref:FecCD family ABC transporter permease n=1 Tax=Rothia sp. HMSC061E04 TaxID=1739431 RepID=UPI0008B3EC68|nr:iron ABC transporter permease [Rothia sp. HMSC061E04]OFQ65752.1 hypothetical protein HMPREF2927_00285 [Rothia sp. HMSC061E04]
MTRPRPGQDRGQGRSLWKARYLPRLLALIVLILVAVALSMLIGTRFIAPDTVWGVLTGNRPEGIESSIIDARGTRTIWGLLIGATLGLAGAGMQGITRNPLGDPGILGVNSGAASALVYAFASIGKDGATPVKLALMGAVLSAGLGSLTSALILTRQNALDDLRRWQVGSIAGKDLENLFPSGILLLVGALILFTGSRTINNLALGDDMAASLGENVNRRRFILFIGITLLVGAAVALAGPIAFLGLMAPHAMRSFISADYRMLLPASALFGAVILLLADTLGRLLMPPQEIQVGVSTIVVGVPVFIYLIRRSKGASLS